MKTYIYRIWQCTWGILQTILGLVLYVKHYKNKHYSYHGAVITEWNSKTSISLGMFVFVSAEPFFVKKYEGQISAAELSNMLLVHEYGHTIQSLILGPLYLILIGIPSTLWGFLMAKKRKEKQIPYSAFITEKWANSLGEYVSKEKSVGNLVLE